MLYNQVIEVWRENGETDLLYGFFKDFTYNSIKLTEEEIRPKRLVINYKTRRKTLKDILGEK